MKKIIIVGWIPGFHKVRMLDLCVDECGLSGSEANEVLKQIFHGRAEVEIRTDADISVLAAKMRDIGAVIEGDTDKEERMRRYLEEQGAPCPFCGDLLRTKVAKQCPHCLMDWHDESHPFRLGQL